jgi:hypothetical protein
VDPGTDGRIILEWALKIHSRRAWNEFMWLRIGTSEGFY